MATGTISLPIPGHFDASAPPGLAFEASLARVLFDAATPQTMHWVFRMPADYASGLTARVQYTMVSAVSGTVEVEASLMAVSDGDAQDLDAAGHDTANTGSATVPATAGHLDEISITMTNADAVAAGDWCAFRLARDADDVTNDTASGDLELRALSLEYVTS